MRLWKHTTRNRHGGSNLRTCTYITQLTRELGEVAGQNCPDARRREASGLGRVGLPSNRRLRLLEPALIRPLQTARPLQAPSHRPPGGHATRMDQKTKARIGCGHVGPAVERKARRDTGILGGRVAGRKAGRSFAARILGKSAPTRRPRSVRRAPESLFTRTRKTPVRIPETPAIDRKWGPSGGGG